MSLGTRVAALVTALLLTGGLGAGATQSPPAGTAAISGRVRLGQHGPAAGQAAVRLTGPLPGDGRVAITDDAGAFRFGGLPAGRYTLVASKAPHVAAHYGSHRPGRGPGVPIAVASGDRVDDLELVLTPGAVLAGWVFDHAGRTQRGALVSLIGGGDGAAHPLATSETDDLGEFRFWGLPAASYRIVVQPGFSYNGAIVPGSTARVGYAPTWFPSVVDATSAERVTVSAGEARADLDVRLQLVPTTRLSGQVLGLDGRPIQASLTVGWPGDAWGLPEKTYSGTRPATPRALTLQDGSFSRSALLPGRYAILARHDVAWGLVELDVRGQLREAVTIQLAETVAVSGRIRWSDGLTRGLPKVRLSLVGGVAGIPLEVAPASVDPEGRFEIPDVVPGSYRLHIDPGTEPPAEVGVVAATLFGTDVLDESFVVPAGSGVRDIDVVLTNRPTILSGTLVDEHLRPAPEYVVVVLPANREDWRPSTRRGSHQRPAQDGSYRFVGLPPGGYLVAAVTELETGDLSDPAFLKLLATGATPVLVEAGQTRALHLKIARDQTPGPE